MLKKYQKMWNKLKTLVYTDPILQYSNFAKPFFFWKLMLALWAILTRRN